MVAHNTGSSRHIGKRMNRQKQGSPPWMLSAAPESVYGMNRGLRRRRPRYRLRGGKSRLRRSASSVMESKEMLQKLCS